jgi:hypothetical protein
MGDRIGGNHIVAARYVSLEILAPLSLLSYPFRAMC